MGKGVLQAVGNVNTAIAPKLVGKDETAQADIDKVRRWGPSIGLLFLFRIDRLR